MGGSVGRAIKKAVKPLKKAENIAKIAFNPLSAGTSFVAGKVTGSKTVGSIAGGAVSPGAELAGQVGSKMVDQPRQMAKDAKRFEENQVAENQAQLKRIKGRKDQSDAEAKASKDLDSRRRKQKRRRGSKGRQSTILTESLGGAGGDTAPGKTLLGK